MELQIDMLKKYDDKMISILTGINIKTIIEWREMMRELSEAGIQTAPPKRYIKQTPEKDIQSRFVKTLDTEYQEYVRTKYGIIDVLTSDSIYEIKVEINNNTIQKPVGQVILYSMDMQKINKVIVAKKFRISSHIERAVASLGIRLIEFA